MKVVQQIKVAVDAIVFGYQDNQLFVALIKQKYGPMQDQWALPGGLVKDKEALKDAVKRELLEETNITVNYLEQLYTFGDDVDRDPRGRTITIAYFGLVNPKQLQLLAGTDAKEAQWYNVLHIPKLAFDHNAIIKKALERIRAKLNYQPVGFDLLEKEFLFSDLENLYCTILQKEIDRRNFRKKILSFGIIEETAKYAPQKAGRPAKLFRFNKVKYNELVKQGFHFEIN